ncbi:MAG: DUF934 domain-containing protein [Alphaproteobacteria bacterium]|nr:DUF934 domain-containing protein [Alphaproteobacteria bacterium]
MSTPEAQPMLWRDGRFVEDDWRFADDSTPLPDGGKLAVSKVRFLADRSTLITRSDGIAIALASGEALGEIENDLERLEMIALHFPRYADGRNYSTARILRDRLRFNGEIRARGDVLRDQITFMIRAGFSAFEVSHPGTQVALRDGRIGSIRHHYQPSSIDGGFEASGYVWRRLSNRA